MLTEMTPSAFDTDKTTMLTPLEALRLQRADRLQCEMPACGVMTEHDLMAQRQLISASQPLPRAAATRLLQDEAPARPWVPRLRQHLAQLEAPSYDVYQQAAEYGVKLNPNRVGRRPGPESPPCAARVAVLFQAPTPAQSHFQLCA